MPEDMLKCSWGIDNFADLCFSDIRHSRIFTTEYVLNSVSLHFKSYMFEALIDSCNVVLSKSVLMQSKDSWRMSVFLFWRLSMSSSLIPELGGREWQ